jgi:hypothetical protein
MTPDQVVVQPSQVLRNAQVRLDELIQKAKAQVVAEVKKKRLSK